MILIPFNFQPDSVAVKTGTYAIPAGRYALVTAYVENGGTFTIGGAAALISKAKSAPVKVTHATSSAYTVPAGRIFRGIISGASSVDGAPFTGVHDYVELGPGSVVSGPGGTFHVIGYTEIIEEANSNVSAQFWVPTGTSISGTGTWKATVQEFLEITE